MTSVKIGVIGGTGLDNPDLLQKRNEKEITTPFGKPSDVLIEGEIMGVECVLLARHGRKHTIMPSNVNYRANIWAMKELGCTHIIVTNACGSLKEEIKPGDIIFPDQFIDRTTKRASTFYDGEHSSPVGVCHIPMHSPFCSNTIEVLKQVTDELGYKYHKSGTIVVIEGPRFSTKAESNLHCSWGADIVGMTTVPEVILANELGLCYASIALATDYDCWRHGQETVSVDAVGKVLKENSHKATTILKYTIPKLADKDWTNILQQCKEMAKSSVMLP